jgi:hypothetical protein
MWPNRREQKTREDFRFLDYGLVGNRIGARSTHFIHKVESCPLCQIGYRLVRGDRGRGRDVGSA